MRPIKATNHADETYWARDARRRARADRRRAAAEHHDSDEAGRQIRAGLELWVGEDDDYPLRGVGEVLAGSTLELGALRLDVAFFGWHIEGRGAIGRYDILRRA